MTIIHLFTFGNHCILVRVMLDPESVLATLGSGGNTPWMGSALQGTIHQFTYCKWNSVKLSFHFWHSNGIAVCLIDDADTVTISVISLAGGKWTTTPRLIGSWFCGEMLHVSKSYQFATLLWDEAFNPSMLLVILCLCPSWQQKQYLFIAEMA